MKTPELSAIVRAALLLFAVSGCASAIESSKREDEARRKVPVPICVKPLERSATGVSKIDPADYWTMVMPTYQPASGSLEASSNDCAGRRALPEYDLLQAKAGRAATIVANPDQAVVIPGPDGFRVVWLRAVELSDGSWSGPLALVRPREGYAEVYGTGAYRGRVDSSRIAFERMGSRIAVTVTEEGCAQAKPGQSCETTLHVFVLAHGRLSKAASVALDRVDYRAFPGVSGVAKHRLTATPVFEDKTMRVMEQVQVLDQNQGTLRKSDLERVFKLAPNGELQPNAPSLWDDVAGGASAPTPAAPAPDSKPKPRSTNR